MGIDVRQVPTHDGFPTLRGKGSDGVAVSIRPGIGSGRGQPDAITGPSRTIPIHRP
jgi:hypothetical protein